MEIGKAEYISRHVDKFAAKVEAFETKLFTLLEMRGKK